MFSAWWLRLQKGCVCVCVCVCVYHVACCTVLRYFSPCGDTCLDKRWIPFWGALMHSTKLAESSRGQQVLRIFSHCCLASIRPDLGAQLVNSHVELALCPSDERNHCTRNQPTQSSIKLACTTDHNQLSEGSQMDVLYNQTCVHKAF